MAETDLANPIASATGADRFQLHRAGIRSVWQYDDTVFEFADGRLLLRGKNGAGKSKALEMLLPFLLDGDTRRLDAVGTAHRTTFAWLMTDGRPPGNHVGYVWLELRRGKSGVERFMTIGCGVKVSSSTQRTDIWFFITDKRVGPDLPLVTGNAPWTADRLRGEIGADNVLDAAAYRQRVRTLLFGATDDIRYGHLLHLLHRLREPNIGDRIERNELPNLLGESLPPVDAQVLDDVAGNFDDLEDIREQLKRTTQTATALREFLTSYQGYTRTQLRSRATQVTEAHRASADANEAASIAATRLTDAKSALDGCRQEVAQLEEELDSASTEIRSIVESDGYKSLVELEDRGNLVVAARAAAQSAVATAEAARSSQAREALLAVEAGAAVEAASNAAGAAHGGVTRALADAAIDPAHAGDAARINMGPPPPAVVESIQDIEEVVEVRRDGVPTATVGVHPRLVWPRLEAIDHLVRSQRIETERVRQAGLRANADATAASRAEERAGELEATLSRALTEVRDAEGRSLEAARRWHSELRAWADEALAQAPATDWLELIGAEPEATDVEEARRIRSAATSGMSDVIQGRCAVEAIASALVAAKVSALESLRSRRSELVSASIIAPVQPGYRIPGAADGAPLFAFIDFIETLEPAHRAGLEGALEASGLLVAWVARDGEITLPLRDDLWGMPHGAFDGPSLADVFTASGEDSASADVVGHLLRSIALVAAGEVPPDWQSWVSMDGRWRLGAATGRWPKLAAQFVGAGARAAHRARLIAALDGEIVEAEAAVNAATESSTNKTQLRQRAEALLAALPVVDSLVAAAASVDAARLSHAKSRAEHTEANQIAAAQRAVATRSTTAFREAAAAQNLTPDVGQLEHRIERLRAVPPLLEKALRELRQLEVEYSRWLSATERWRLAGEDRLEPEATAAHQIAQYRESKLAFETLQASVGSSPDALRGQHAAAKKRYDSAKRGLPKARLAENAAVGEHARAESTLQGARSAVQGASEAVSGAVGRLRDALSIQGVGEAAFGADWKEVSAELASVGDDPARIAATIGRRAAGPPITDSTILKRYDVLLASLAGGFDVAADEQDGIKLFTLFEAAGAQPVALVAERMSGEAAASANRLTEREREVFEKFLLGSLGDTLRHHLHDAAELVRNMNDVLRGKRTSHGLGVELEWNLRDDASTPTATAKKLLQVAGEIRSAAQKSELREALQALIAAERLADPTAGFRKVLEAALDYRRWHHFVVRIVDDSNLKRRQTLGPRAKVSQGEQRVLAYLTLFSAAVAHFDSIGRNAPQSPRLILLDDAFAKVDEPTHGRLLEFLVQLRLDFIITSERIWGMFPGVPSLAIYECLRDPHVPGVATISFRWDGQNRHQASA